MLKGYNRDNKTFNPKINNVDYYLEEFSKNAQELESILKDHVDFIVRKKNENHYTIEEIVYIHKMDDIREYIWGGIKEEYELIAEDFQKWIKIAESREYKSELFIRVNLNAKKMCAELVENLPKIDEDIRALRVKAINVANSQDKVEANEDACGVKELVNDVNSRVNKIRTSIFNARTCHFIIERYIAFGEQLEGTVTSKGLSRSWKEAFWQKFNDIEEFMTPKEPSLLIEDVIKGAKEFVENELKSALEKVPTTRLSEAGGAQSAFASRSSTKSSCTIL